MRKKPYKASELFNEICKQLTLPDILDYHHGEDLHDEEIKSYEWDFGNDLMFGSNEGIYLTMYAKSRNKEIMLGVFKTLDTSAEAMHKMASLLADFIIAGNKFVNENLDDFTWDGYNVKPAGSLFSYDCSTIEGAKKRYEELREKYDDIVVFDYANRKEISFCKEKKEPETSIEPSDEIMYAIEQFENPLLVELQVWEENTVKYFEEKGYESFHADDGSWWISDESRYFD